jgi:hypothetical protein
VRLVWFVLKPVVMKTTLLISFLVSTLLFACADEPAIEETYSENTRCHISAYFHEAVPKTANDTAPLGFLDFSLQFKIENQVTGELTFSSVASKQVHQTQGITSALNLGAEADVLLPAERLVFSPIISVKDSASGRFVAYSSEEQKTLFGDNSWNESFLYQHDPVSGLWEAVFGVGNQHYTQCFEQNP